MQGHCWLAHALVEDVFVQERCLDVIVKEEGFAESWHVGDLVGLVLSFALKDHLFHSVLPDGGRGVGLINEHSGCVAVAHSPKLWVIEPRQRFRARQISSQGQRLAHSWGM